MKMAGVYPQARRMKESFVLHLRVRRAPNKSSPTPSVELGSMADASGKSGSGDLQLGKALAAMSGTPPSVPGLLRRATDVVDPDKTDEAPKLVVGIGSSFLKMFVGNDGDSLFLPRAYTIEPENVSHHWCSITAPTGEVYRVWVEEYLDSLIFRAGWHELMVREGVDQGDIGIFTRTGAMAFSLTIMTRGGMQKEPVAPDADPKPSNKRTDVRWQDVKFFATKGVMRSHKLVSTLHALWVTSNQPFILYATHLKHSAVTNGAVLLSKDVSAKLPAGPISIGLVFNGSRLIYDGVLVKSEKHVCRITSGWLHFVRANGIKIGRVYVFKFEIRECGWQATVYQV